MSSGVRGRHGEPVTHVGGVVADVPQRNLAEEQRQGESDDRDWDRP
jgi:hypothetical protein